jgi:hypothetical protein
MGHKPRIKPSILENSTTPEPPPIVGLRNIDNPGGFWGSVMDSVNRYETALVTLSEGTWAFSDGRRITVPRGETRQVKLFE